MNQSENDVQEGEAVPIHKWVVMQQGALKAAAKELGKMATALGPLNKPKVYEDVKKALIAVEKAAKKVPAGLASAVNGGQIIDHIRTHLEDRVKQATERLGQDLGEAFKARGLTMRVLRREGPIEVRTPPLAIIIDRDKGKASLQFAKETLLQVPAECDAILAGYDGALKVLNTPFDPQAFHEHCYSAWQACRAATGAKSERVEIVDFLPYLAIHRQKPAFLKDPRKKSFQDYTRAQFAWDVLRLRREKALIHKNRRLNLGVATGSSASKKSRVIFFEDEQGNGEFKLTVFFSKEDS